MVGQVGNSVERLPPRTLSVFCTWLSVKDLESSLSVLRDFLLLVLVRTSHRENTLEVFNDILVLSLLGTEELSHFLVLSELIRSNTKHFLDITRIKDLTVADLNHTLDLAVQRKSQRVIAYNTNRSEPNVSRESIFVEVGEEQIRIDLIALEELERFLDLSETPNDLTALERASSMHLHITSGDKLIEEFECIFVLHRIPVIRDNIENLVVERANKSGLTDLDLLAANFGEGRDFFYSPVETSSLKHLLRGQIRRNLDAKTMPGNIASISHLSLTINVFNFVSHDINLVQQNQSNHSTDHIHILPYARIKRNTFLLKKLGSRSPPISVIYRQINGEGQQLHLQHCQLHHQ